MYDFLLYCSIFLCILIFICLYRAVIGPTLYDRIIGAGFIGTKTAVILLFIGFMYVRIDMFIDLALVYSALNFIGTLIISKVLIKRVAGTK